MLNSSVDLIYRGGFFMFRLILIFILSIFINGCVNLQEKKIETSADKDVSKKKIEEVSSESKKTELPTPTVSEKAIKESVADVSTNRIIVSVPGMVCQMCVHGMRKVFKDSVQNAEKDVQVDLGKKTVTLNLLTALSDDDIKKKVVQAGYKVDKITRL